MEKIHIQVLHKSCDRRKLDGKKISDYLKKKGHPLVNKPKDADIIIIVTCAAQDYIVDDAINKIKELQKFNAELIVAGCLPDIEKEKLEKVFNGRIITTKNIDNIDTFFKEGDIKFCNIDDAHVLFRSTDISRPLGALMSIIENIEFIRNIFNSTTSFIIRKIFGDFSPINRRYGINYIIRISWGCLGSCTYCGIKKAIGKHHSKPLNDCIDELKKGLKDGYKNFVITGDDSGAYGTDINSSLPELLDKMTRIEGDFNIIFDSSHPVWIVKYIHELEEIFKRNKIKHFGIPIQSANPRILKLMCRYNNVEKMKEVFHRIKKFNPDIFLHTHCICGFPTETEKEFNDTLEFFKEIDINSCFFYVFSCKTGTPAEKMQQVPEQKISIRFKHAKKYLKKLGYVVITLSKSHFYAYKKYSNIKARNSIKVHPKKEMKIIIEPKR